MSGARQETIIHADRASGLRLRRWWQARELLYFLWLRDITVRYRYTIIGIGWAIVQPLAFICVAWFAFGRFAQLGPDVTSNGQQFLFYAAGFIAWVYCSAAVNGAATSLVQNFGLMNRVYFPRIVLPTVSVCVPVVDALLAGSVCVLIIVCLGNLPAASALMPLVAGGLVLVVCAWACGAIASVLNLRFRDVRQLMPFLLQLWLFASPVFYASDAVGPEWYWWVEWNPLAWVIDTWRVGYYGEWLPISRAVALVPVLLVTVCAAIFFERHDRDLVDMA